MTWKSTISQIVNIAHPFPTILVSISLVPLALACVAAAFGNEHISQNSTIQREMESRTLGKQSFSEDPIAMAGYSRMLPNRRRPGKGRRRKRAR